MRNGVHYKGSAQSCAKKGKQKMQDQYTNEWLELNATKDDFIFRINGRVCGGKYAPEVRHFEKQTADGKPFKSTLLTINIETLGVAKGSKYPKRQKVQAWGRLAQELGAAIKSAPFVGHEISCAGTFALRTYDKPDGSKGYETQFTAEAIDIGEALHDTNEVQPTSDESGW